MENLNELLSKYQHIVKKIKANEFIFYLISWDSQTEAPVGCFEERAKQMEFLSGEHYRFLTSEDTVNTIVDTITSYINKKNTFKIALLYFIITKTDNAVKTAPNPKFPKPFISLLAFSTSMKVSTIPKISIAIDIIVSIVLL